MGETNILECHGISKAFGGTQALNKVDFSLRRGEVHALLGENGAGKSTLMKCIIGLHKQEEGYITFEGKPYSARGPAEAIEKGIAMVHQELNPEPHLTVAESIFLNREDTTGIFLNKKKTNERAQKILDKFGFHVKSTVTMEQLTLAQAQMVEIIRAVSCNAKVIIMDEPTSSLDSEETERLFETIRDLKREGVAIIYISHRMEEIFEICDRVSVFRDGTYVGTKDIADTNKDELIAMMIGHQLTNIFPKVEVPIGDVVFRCEGLTGKGFSNISFEVHEGEILGFAGLVGSGRSETMRAIFGLGQLESGNMYLNGEEITIKNPSQAVRMGIAMVNEDRKAYGLCLSRSILENISLPSLWQRQKRLFINHSREKKEVEEISKSLTVKASGLEAEAYSLSGGNQQKVVLSKWIMAKPKLLIMDEPTRGVDVGAKAEIHSLMCRFASQGMAIIMVSSEYPEVSGMSDRMLIYHEGKIVGEVQHADIVSGMVTQQDVLKKQFGE